MSSGKEIQPDEFRNYEIANNARNFLPTIFCRYFSLSLNRVYSQKFIFDCRISHYMPDTSSGLIIFGVLFTIIGLIGTVIGALLAGAIPLAMLSTISTLTTYIFEPMLIIGIIVLIIGVALYFRKPAGT